MADRSKKTKIVDSYTTLRAAQRRVQERSANKSPPPKPPEPERPKSEPEVKRPGTHIGRTVMPTKHDIVCYSCEFEFKVTGKSNNTYCPKCKAMLDLKDHTITGAFSDELVTAGKVTLTKTSILDGGRITANNVCLQGTVKEGRLQVHHTLELAEGAVIPEDMIHARNLRIAENASFTFRKKATFRNVDIHGEFKANLWADGLVTVHPGGHLKGKLHTAHFCVLDGGGLTADVAVEPGQKTTPPPPKGKSADKNDADTDGN